MYPTIGCGHAPRTNVAAGVDGECAAAGGVTVRAVGRGKRISAGIAVLGKSEDLVGNDDGPDSVS